MLSVSVYVYVSERVSERVTKKDKQRKRNRFFVGDGDGNCDNLPVETFAGLPSSVGFEIVKRWPEASDPQPFLHQRFFHQRTLVLSSIRYSTEDVVDDCGSVFLEVGSCIRHGVAQPKTRSKVRTRRPRRSIHRRDRCVRSAIVGYSVDRPARRCELGSRSRLHSEILRICPEHWTHIIFLPRPFLDPTH